MGHDQSPIEWIEGYDWNYDKKDYLFDRLSFMVFEELLKRKELQVKSAVDVFLKKTNGNYLIDWRATFRDALNRARDVNTIKNETPNNSNFNYDPTKRTVKIDDLLGSYLSHEQKAKLLDNPSFYELKPYKAINKNDDISSINPAVPSDFVSRILAYYSYFRTKDIVARPEILREIVLCFAFVRDYDSYFTHSGDEWRNERNEVYGENRKNLAWKSYPKRTGVNKPATGMIAVDFLTLFDNEMKVEILKRAFGAFCIGHACEPLMTLPIGEKFSDYGYPRYDWRFDKKRIRNVVKRKDKEYSIFLDSDLQENIYASPIERLKNNPELASPLSDRQNSTGAHEIMKTLKMISLMPEEYIAEVLGDEKVMEWFSPEMLGFWSTEYYALYKFCGNPDYSKPDTKPSYTERLVASDVYNVNVVVDEELVKEVCRLNTVQMYNRLYDLLNSLEDKKLFRKYNQMLQDIELSDTKWCIKRTNNKYIAKIQPKVEP